MRTLLDLAKALEKKAESIEKEACELAVKAAIVIVKDLANVTPVDTSKALSNWIVSLDAPTVSKISAHEKGFRGSTKKPSSITTIERAILALKNKKPNQKIFITNNQDYIKQLNEGSSSQEPAGFVERAEQLGRRVISEFKFKGL